MIATVEASLTNVNSALAQACRAAAKKFSIQVDFVQKLSDTLTAGIGNLVDADMATESAQLAVLAGQAAAWRAGAVDRQPVAADHPVAVHVRTKIIRDKRSRAARAKSRAALFLCLYSDPAKFAHRPGKNFPQLGKFCRGNRFFGKNSAGQQFPPSHEQRKLAKSYIRSGTALAISRCGAKRPFEQNARHQKPERRQVMLSVNTNTGAMVALQYLNKTNASSFRPSRTPSTRGLKVASAKDDGATFAIAQNMRGDVAGYSAVTRQPQPRHVLGRRCDVGRSVDLRSADPDEAEGACRVRRFAGHGQPRRPERRLHRSARSDHDDRSERRLQRLQPDRRFDDRRSRRWRLPTARKKITVKRRRHEPVAAPS